VDGTETFSLEQNFPNPFRNETIIKFTLPRAGKVNLSLFDMNGRLVKVLVNEAKESGTHAVNLNSGILSSGLYYYKLQTVDNSAVKKLTIQ
jgi:Secretion system C-terminal sorting domain